MLHMWSTMLFGLTWFCLVNFWTNMMILWLLFTRIPALHLLASVQPVHLPQAEGHAGKYSVITQTLFLSSVPERGILWPDSCCCSAKGKGDQAVPDWSDYCGRYAVVSGWTDYIFQTSLFQFSSAVIASSGFLIFTSYTSLEQRKSSSAGLPGYVSTLWLFQFCPFISLFRMHKQCLQPSYSSKWFH